MNRKMFTILFAMLLVGCSSIAPTKEYVFASGGYLLELGWETGENYSVEALIDNKSGNLEFISPYNGKIIMSGIIEGNKFLASIYRSGTYVSYRGVLTSDNHIQGRISGRVLAGPNRACPTDVKRSDTIPNNGKFRIVPHNLKKSKAILGFLPTIGAPESFVPRLYDPRTYSFILMPGARLFDFKKLVYGSSGTIASFEKEPISLKQLEDNIKTETKKFGNDIPIEIYAGKDVAISSLNTVLESCQKAGVYRFAIKALQPEWEGLYSIPIEMSPEGAVRNELNLKIAKRFCLVGGKPQKDIAKFLSQVRKNNHGRIISITYSDDATIQELLPILVLCRKSRLTRVYLKNKKRNHAKPQSHKEK